MLSPNIYIAGPDVFFPNAPLHFQEIGARLEEHGMRAVTPADGGLSMGAPSTPETACRIFHANIALINHADGLLVNLNAFRGMEPDSGTCFEVGYAYALGKPIVAYIDAPEMYCDRVARLRGVAPGGVIGRRYDAIDQCLIEELGLPLNLMLACSTTLITNGLNEAISALSEKMKMATAARLALAAAH
jgi:nucleoside 2-deoxyribosyltransferase